MLVSASVTAVDLSVTWPNAAAQVKRPPKAITGTLQGHWLQKSPMWARALMQMLNGRSDAITESDVRTGSGGIRGVFARSQLILSDDMTFTSGDVPTRDVQYSAVEWQCVDPGTKEGHS